MLITGVQSPATASVPVPAVPIFKIEQLPEQIQKQMQGVSYHEGAPVALSELRLVTLSYYDDQEAVQIGEIVVHQAVAEDIKDIFKILYEAKYPIAKMTRIETYGGDDELSMADDNTSGFNHRQVAGTSKLSLHAYGLAIDINPVKNPYVTDHKVSPYLGRAYVDRTLEQQGMIMKGDLLYTAFISKGWQWGGDWKSIKDYQHFQKSIDQIVKP
jgi:hypothetical protein